MTRKNLFILLGIFIFAYLLRVIFLSQNALTFEYDQARDAYYSLQIAHGDLKVLGPPASTPGLYHGVLYYYLLAPAYLIGRGNPVIAAYWIAFLNACTIFIIYILAYLLTKKNKISLLSCLLFAISFEAVQYATWLSNPTIGIWSVPITYLGLWLLTEEKKKWGAIILGLGLGISMQAEIFLIYHIIPIIIWLYIKRKNISLKDILLLKASFLIAVSTMVIAELKFGFRGVGGIFNLLHSSDTVVAAHGFGDFVVLFLNQLGRAFANSIYPGNVGYGAGFIFILIILTVFSLRNKKNMKNPGWEIFLLLWIFAHLSIVTLGGTSTPFILVGITTPVVILTAIYLDKLLNKKMILVILIILLAIVYGNISNIFREGPFGQTIFAIQKDMTLKYEIQAVDYTYKVAPGEKFTINSVTSPLWINIVWTYLYKWHGMDQYGYIPSFHGRDQIGIIDSLPTDVGKIKNYFLIIEPLNGIPTRYLEETKGQEDSYSKLLEEKKFGDIVVERRIKI